MGKSFGSARADAQCQVEIAQRLPGTSLLEAQNAQQVIGVEIPRRARKDFEVQPLGKLPVAPLLGIQRPTQKRLRIHPFNQRDRVCVV